MFILFALVITSHAFRQKGFHYIRRINKGTLLINAATQCRLSCQSFCLSPYQRVHKCNHTLHLHTHKYHINIIINGACKRQSSFSTCLNSFSYYKQVSDIIIIWLSLVLDDDSRQINRYVIAMAGSVENAFVGLTEEDGQHLSEKLKVTTPLQINAVTYTVAIIRADLESLCLSITKSSEVQAICSRFGVIQEVGFFFKWSFERSTALKTLIVRMNVEGALRTKNTATLTRFVKRDASSEIMQFWRFLVFVSH
ncbi:hypothetical protein Tsp_08293 [Trichinella spiralis]|uniref:hypothetical protein n=1 Tax=Trichinella spiralis TaxID=6334 RepID=UPI0001EFCD1D|nr:hypothetical protein Tsp_08293 [Trichinella spiralis]